MLTAEKLCKFWSEDFRVYRVARAAMIGYQAEVGIVLIIVLWLQCAVGLERGETGTNGLRRLLPVWPRVNRS